MRSADTELEIWNSLPFSNPRPLADCNLCNPIFTSPLCFRMLEQSLLSGNDLLFIALKVEEEFLHGGGLQKHFTKNVMAQMHTNYYCKHKTLQLTCAV